ncbi:MAG: hypothetical protein QM286_00315 [Acidobacteriota bacterium]|nr:hypothetical protein [Acidobacteriota bacterium]
MMKFSKTLLVVLGVVISLAFAGVMIYVVIQVNQLHAVAIANRSAGFMNPRNWMLIGAGLGFLGGFMLGLGLALPSQTFKARYAELRRAEEIVAAKQTGLDRASAADVAPTATDEHVADPRRESEAQ